MYYVCFDQMQNNLISQAGQMATHGAPNDLIPAMNQVGCIVLGPLIQEVLYPLLHRRRIYLTPVARITAGFAFFALSMLYATAVQLLIYRSPPCHEQTGECGPDRVSVWIQAPLYFLISAGEIFAYVTALEHTYHHAPKSMKVVVQAVGLLVGGAGSACAMALTPVARDPYPVTFYGSLAGGMAVTTGMFWVLFRKGSRQHTAVANNSRPQAYQSADRVSDAAPSLGPIDFGSPIELPGKTVSRLPCSSCTLHLTNYTPCGVPALPRKSSRRQQAIEVPAASQSGSCATDEMPQSPCLPPQRLRIRPQPQPAGWIFCKDN